MRALLVSGAMIVACENARDAKASKAGDVAKGSVVAPVSIVGAHRDSLPGFTVPPQCAVGSIPLPRKPAPTHGGAEDASG